MTTQPAKKMQPPCPAILNPAQPEHFLRSFQVCNQPMIIVDAETLLVMEANSAACTLLGREASDLFGTDLLQLAAGEQAQLALRRAVSPTPLAGEAGFNSPADVRFMRADGFIMLAEMRGTTFQTPEARPWALLLLRDATQEHVAQSQLWAETQAASYQYFIECIGEGFLALDDGGLVIFANATSERLLGQPREALLGQHVTALFPGMPDELVKDAVERERPLDHQPIVLDLRQINDQPRLFELDVHRNPHGVGVLFRDIQDRVAHEMEIARLNATMTLSQELLRSKNTELNHSLEQLANLNDQLAEADRLKSEFLANTSHELRTPLNSIIGFLQLICEGLCETEAEKQQYVNNALASAQHLLSLINDVLDIAKIEAGKLTLLIDDVDIPTLFQEVNSLTHVQAHQKMLKLSFADPPPDHRHIRADFHKTKQILINLVGNAIKFTDKGHVIVKAVPDSERGDMMYFTVEDTGMGVPPDQQEKVFEKFVQVDGTSTRKHQGTGLGLTITKNLVELMGGSIRLSSEGPDCGTTIHFTLPRGSRPGASDGLDELDEWKSENGSAF